MRLRQRATLRELSLGGESRHRRSLLAEEVGFYLRLRRAYLLSLELAIWWLLEGCRILEASVDGELPAAIGGWHGLALGLLGCSRGSVSFRPIESCSGLGLGIRLSASWTRVDEVLVLLQRACFARLGINCFQRVLVLLQVHREFLLVKTHCLGEELFGGAGIFVFLAADAPDLLGLLAVVAVGYLRECPLL